MNLQALREQTRELHEATEALLPLSDPAMDRKVYAERLLCFSRVVLAWDAWAAAHVPPALHVLVQTRRRSPLLLKDLRFFSLAPEATGSSTIQAVDTLLQGTDPQSPEYTACFLGAMYVMEGSTLGGQYIARHVEERLGLEPGVGDAYFRGYGEQTGSMWNAFREVLAAVPDEYTDLVIRAAKAMFAFVQDTLRRPALYDGAQPGGVLAGIAS